MNETVASETPIDPRWKRNIALFLTGQGISMFGSMLVQFGIMWYLTLETGSATLVTLYAIFAFGPEGISADTAGPWNPAMIERMVTTV